MESYLEETSILRKKSIEKLKHATALVPEFEAKKFDPFKLLDLSPAEILIKGHFSLGYMHHKQGQN